MGFIGIFILAAAMWIIVIGIIAVFIPSFIIALINLISGCVHHWPKHNIILFSIFGTIAGLILLGVFSIYLFYVFNHANEAASTSEAIALLFYL